MGRFDIWITFLSPQTWEKNGGKKKDGRRVGGGTANHHLDVYFNFTVFGWHLKNSNLGACDMSSLNKAAGKELTEKWYSCYLTSVTNVGGICVGSCFSRITNFWSFSHCGLQIPHMRPDKGTLQSDKDDSRLSLLWVPLRRPLFVSQKCFFFISSTTLTSAVVHAVQENNKSQGGKE